MRAEPSAGSRPEAAPDTAPDTMLGRKIGLYRVLRKIGEGGMGAVYEASHATLGRRAAIKLLRRNALSDATAAARFFNEARAISMVSHPCLVTIYEHGTYTPGDGGADEAYIVMEYIEGESLRARLNRQYLGGSAIGLVRQLASALTVTHKQRIVHRDLKPDNIMLVADDTVGGGVRAKILDFGLAKLLHQAEPGEAEPPGQASSAAAPAAAMETALPRSVKTRTGVLIGTPMYMSPEQCHGSGSPDDKSDVYSLGIIFFELLYGDPPFVSRSAGELYAMHLFFPVPELRELVPGIQPKLAELVHRMLEKKPAARPSMDELLVELQALPDSGLVDGPVESRPCAAANPHGSTGQDVGPSGLLRRHLARLADKPEPAPGEPWTPGESLTSAAASRGEQVAAQPTPRRRMKLAAGGVVLAIAAVVSLVAVKLQRPSRTASAAPVVSAPAPSAAADPPAPAAPPPPAPLKQTKRSSASAVGRAPKEKSVRKTANESKKDKGNSSLRRAEGSIVSRNGAQRRAPAGKLPP